MLRLRDRVRARLSARLNAGLRVTGPGLVRVSSSVHAASAQSESNDSLSPSQPKP